MTMLSFDERAGWGLTKACHIEIADGDSVLVSILGASEEQISRVAKALGERHKDVMFVVVAAETSVSIIHGEKWRNEGQNS